MLQIYTDIYIYTEFPNTIVKKNLFPKEKYIYKRNKKNKLFCLMKFHVCWRNIKKYINYTSLQINYLLTLRFGVNKV